MTYYRCVTCNRPILFKEYTDYGKECKKCGTPVAKPVATLQPQWRKEGKDYVKVEPNKLKSCNADTVISEEEMSLKDVRKLVRKMELETYQMQELLAKIHDKMIMLVSELEK